jgi:hypothetical protein
MLQKESVDEAILDLILSLHAKDYLQDFILVGGTGLALIIGHRKSMDIDLSTSKDFDVESLLEKLEIDFDFQLDFLDLFFLLADHKYDVESLLSNFQAKYSQRNALYALKSLNYFEDVDVSDWPELIKRKDTSWDKVQEFINKACELYISKIT